MARRISPKVKSPLCRQTPLSGFYKKIEKRKKGSFIALCAVSNCIQSYLQKKDMYNKRKKKEEKTKRRKLILQMMIIMNVSTQKQT
jgi:hypothetical protein